jgi:sacsin
LYLALLERIAQERNNNRWWPGTLEDVHLPTDLGEDDTVMIHEDVPTAIMLKAFYSKHLPKSSRNIYYSMYSNESFRKSDAILYPARPKPSAASPASIPSSVERIVETLKPKHVIKPTKLVAARLEEVGLLQSLGPTFIRQLLLNGGGETIRGGLSKKDLAELLDWLVGEEERTNLLDGLPLLILQDETWRVFETEGQIFYGSPKSLLFVEKGLFPADRFVHPDAISERLLKILSSSAFGIAELDAAGLRQLVEERLDGLDAPNRAPWVDLFWRMYPELPKTDLLTSIETLPLVPKMSGTSFKSLIECRESGLINDDASSEGLVGYFQDLGIDVIPIKRFPPELQDVLQSRDYNLRGSLFTRFLRCVSPIIETAVDKMKNWSPDRQSDFATWVRGEIWRCLQTDYSVVRKLPVWLARRGSETSLCPANEVRLLPRGISIDAGRFSRSFMTEDTKVGFLDIPRQTLPQLYHALTFPRFLQEGDDERIYKNLLTSFLRLTTHDIPSIPVPNASRVMVDCNALVDRNTLFMAAFGSSSTLFLLPSFTSFTSRLETWGFRLALDLNLFVLCAQAIHDDDRPDSEKLDRAQIVYQAYCDSLPVYLPSNEQWKSLDDIRFIPRDVHESRKIGSQEVELPRSIRGLPLLVSPRQVVQRRFHSICWTQRTLLQEEPHARILVAFGEFGTPSVEEVVSL